MGYGRKAIGPSQVPKRRRATRENNSREKGKKLTLLEVRCTDDPRMVSKRCLKPQETSRPRKKNLEPWEISRTRKKIEDLHLHINEGVLT